MSEKNPFLGLGFNSWSQSFGRPPSDTTPITYGITISGNTFALRSTGTVNYDVDWGDGSTETSLTSNTKEHSYADGSYSVAVTPTGVFRPYIANNADGDRITSVVITAEANFGNTLDGAWQGASNMTSFECPFAVTSSVGATLYGYDGFRSTWRECSSLTSFPLIDTSNASHFEHTWRDCTSLTSFPKIDASVATTLLYCWFNCNSLTSFPDIDFPNVDMFAGTWRSCSGLTSFPSIDTSSGTNFGNAWQGCSSLTSFPLLDSSSGTNFNDAWNGCTSLTSFPLLNTSNGSSFQNAWNNCSGLTSFPLIDTSSATNFNYSWRDCTSLTSFPKLVTNNMTTFIAAWQGCSNLANFDAGMFDTTGTLVSNAFAAAFTNCALTAQSIENILVSLNTNGSSNIDLNINGGTNASKTTWSAAAVTAYDNLITKGWTISYNA